MESLIKEDIMSKKVFVFPGQGSQSIGMGNELPNQEIFDKANEILGFNLKKLCSDGPDESLKATQNAQPAILTVSYMQYLLQEDKPDLVAGHSLGEYSALVAAGVIKFEDAVKLVNIRGKLMEEAVPRGKGAMAAILGMSVEDIKSVFNEVGGEIQVANYNCPGQIVISGETEAINKCCQYITKNLSKKAIPLAVSGPFHSTLMKPAADKFAEYLDEIELNEPKIPVIMNVTADYLKSASDVKELLIKQLFSSVLWQQSIEKMINEGADDFIEVGPGKVLSGLIKKIKRGMK